jgi:4-hydroxyphenylacetate 3-monooxygenase
MTEPKNIALKSHNRLKQIEGVQFTSPEANAIYQQSMSSISYIRGNKEDLLWKQAYLSPTSLEELKLKRFGFFQVANGSSVFADGLTDYALSLLSGWYTQRKIAPISDYMNTTQLSELFEDSRIHQKLITTSFYKIKPSISEAANTQIITKSSEGLLIHGIQTFMADALFADELLVFLNEDGENSPSGVALVPTNSENLILQVHRHFDYGITVAYENVMIPWKRVLVFQNTQGVKQLLQNGDAKAIADYQWVSRQLETLESIIGTAFALAEETGASKEPHIQRALGK